MPTPEQFQAPLPGTVVGASSLITPGGDIGPAGPTGATGTTGATGPTGAAGAPGENANTTTSAPFTVPLVGQTVSVTVADAGWIVVGQMLYVDTAGGGTGLAGVLQVTAKAGNTITLLNPTPAPAIPLASSSADGLLKMVSGLTTDYIRGDNTSQNLVTAVQPTIWSARLRSFQALGNNTFEVDQRTCFTGVTNNGWALDRWFQPRSGTMNATAVGTFGLVPVPGTSFNITQFFLRTTLTGQETSLAAGDYLFLQHSAEGPFLREICSDVMSLQILVRSSVAGLKFGITLREGGTTKTLALLCTIPSANTWTLLTFPNLPSFVSSGAGLALTPGSAGFYLTVSLAVGTTNTAPANGTWQSGAFVQAAGADNFASKPVNSTFDCAYISLEPGPLCSNPPMDRPFTDNLRDCWRYYEKSYEYATKAGTSTYQGTTGTYNYVNNVTMNMGARFKASKATTPSVSTYSPVTGALNVVAASNGETTVGAINGPTTESPFYSLTTSATLVVGQYTWAQWIADTGW